MTMIELPDEQAAALKAKAAARGLTLKAWLGKLADEGTGTRLKPKKSAYGLLANMAPVLPPRKSTGTAGRCSAASAKTSSNDRWRRRHSHGPLVSAKESTASATARQFMDDAAAAGRDIVLSPISLAEIVYLVEKNRLPASAYHELKNALADPDCVIEEAPFTVEIVDAMRQVPRADVPDMPDRLVAATGVYLGVPVISCDGRIRSSNVHTVW